MTQDVKANNERLVTERRELKKAQKDIRRPIGFKAARKAKLGPIVIEDVIREVKTLKDMLPPPRPGVMCKDTQYHEQVDVILDMLQHNPMDSEPLSPLYPKGKEK